MSVINKLATSLGRRDDVPNQELAKQIASAKDASAVKELVELLSHKSKDIQSDSIKVLYEIGELEPSLIAPYSRQFLALLRHKNNRLQWGAMMALNSITLENPKAIYNALPEIVEAAEKGSVITRDHAVSILVTLCSVKKYADDAFALLIDQLSNSPANQVPMYAEKALPVINDKNKEQFIQVLNTRLADIDKESKRKRVDKVINKLRK